MTTCPFSRLRLQIMYDQTFAQHYDESAIDKVVVHAKSFFLHASLNTTIHLQVLPYHETPLKKQVAERDNKSGGG